MDGAGSWWLEPSPGDVYSRPSQLNGSSGAFGDGYGNLSAVTSSLRFQVSKSIRTSIIILASLNALAGAATAAGTYWDCYKKSTREVPDFEFKSSFWKLVGPAEVFPFVLSLSIVAQGIIFAVVQAFGLQSFSIMGCESLSRVLLPLFLLIPYMHFTFGVEATFQALRPHKPFSSRHKWGVPACLAVPLLGAVGTYFVFTRFISPPNFCFASLIYFLKPWGFDCFALLLGIASTLLLGSGIIFYRLRQVSGIGEQQRMTASWMASFMVLASLSMTVAAPFFYSVSAGNASRFTLLLQWQLSMAAVVMVNMSGITTGLLYIVLRSTKLGRVGPKGYHEFDTMRRPRTIKLLSFVFTRQMEQPIPKPAKLRTRPDTNYVAPGNNGSAARAGEDRVGGQGAVAAGKPMTLGASTTASTSAPSSAQRHVRKKSYVLFPRDNVDDPQSRHVLPAKAHAHSGKDAVPSDAFPVETEALPTTEPLGRNASIGSSSGLSATLPIGLRVSHIKDMPPVASLSQDPTSATSSQRNPPSSSIPLPSIIPAPPSIIWAADADAMGKKEKQLPPVPLALPEKAMEKGPETPREEPPRPGPAVYMPQLVVIKDKDKADGKLRDGPLSQTRRAPKKQRFADEVEWI